MMGSLESNGIQFWTNEKGDEDNNINNLRIGFNPHTQLIVTHPPDESVTWLEIFSMEKWSCTGKAITGIPAIYNNEGEELCHGSVIDFDQRPAHLLPDEVLLF